LRKLAKLKTWEYNKSMAKVNRPIKEEWEKHKDISPLQLSKNNVVRVKSKLGRKRLKKAK